MVVPLQVAKDKARLQALVADIPESDFPSAASPKDVSNGDIGQVTGIDPEGRELVITFDGRGVVYDFIEMDEVSLAYPITIHKSQCSEFPAVVVPMAMQHFMLLQRNLIYSGMTHGKKIVILTGQKKALGLAVRNDRAAERFSALYERLVR